MRMLLWTLYINGWGSYECLQEIHRSSTATQDGEFFFATSTQKYLCMGLENLAIYIDFSTIAYHLPEV